MSGFITPEIRPADFLGGVALGGYPKIPMTGRMGPFPKDISHTPVATGFYWRYPCRCLVTFELLTWLPSPGGVFS